MQNIHIRCNLLSPSILVVLTLVVLNALSPASAFARDLVDIANDTGHYSLERIPTEGVERDRYPREGVINPKHQMKRGPVRIFSRLYFPVVDTKSVQNELFPSQFDTNTNELLTIHQLGFSFPLSERLAIQLVMGLSSEEFLLSVLNGVFDSLEDPEVELNYSSFEGTYDILTLGQWGVLSVSAGLSYAEKGASFDQQEFYAASYRDGGGEFGTSASLEYRFPIGPVELNLGYQVQQGNGGAMVGFAFRF